MTHHPPLTARRPAPLYALAMLVFCGFFASTAAADDAPNADLGKPFAQVWRLQGDVFATGKLGTPRRLREGATVHVGEQVKAGSNGEAVLKTSDAGIVAVRPNAEFVAERYAAEGKSSDRQVLRLITGSLRVITGWIARFNRNDHRIVTATATIGIRGTDHEPYVLSADAATGTNKPGTYDKVNRGETAVETAGGQVVVPPGKVGFARAQDKGVRTRALMTVLLPTLLDRVPDFYVPGAFDAELDRYAESLERQGPKPAPTATMPAPAPAAAELPPATVAIVPLPVGCIPEGIARHWLSRFDHAIATKDVRTILGLFAPEMTARATVRNADGSTTTLHFTRDEMVQSTLRAIASLRDYRQRRLTVEGRLAGGESESTCSRLDIRSLVIEQGVMNNAPYRFESTEDYVLELRNGEWLATQAASTQR